MYGKGFLYILAILSFCRQEVGQEKSADKKQRRKILKIDSGTIGMESARSYQASTKTVRRFQITDYQDSLEQSNYALNTGVKEEMQQAGKETVGEENTDSSSGTENGKVTGLEEWQGRLRMSRSRVKIRSSEENTIRDLRQYTLRYIFDMLFAHRRGRLNEWMEENGYTQPTESAVWGQNAHSSTVVSNAFQNNSLQSLNYVQETHFAEREETSFSTVGTVKTSDGREINFNVNVTMSRSFEQYYGEAVNFANFSLCDPLVINMDTDVAELSDQTFYFDIDADGEKDEISMLGSGSGYLALDQNGDGIINDGSELFGTRSGDGFADLAKYDEDGNGWIDEGDAIWSKLKIWTKDENGEDVLCRLADKGVGALCLQNAATDFALKGAEGRTNGMIRKTGVFLYENGNVGTLQHVDVAKYYKEA